MRADPFTCWMTFRDGYGSVHESRNFHRAGGRAAYQWSQSHIGRVRIDTQNADSGLWQETSMSLGKFLFTVGLSLFVLAVSIFVICAAASSFSYGLL
jgi:hypothetical protein